MGWQQLGILFGVCAVLCAVGFYRFVYFLSIGYGFAIAGGAIAVALLTRGCTGLRLCGCCSLSRTGYGFPVSCWCGR